MGNPDEMNWLAYWFANPNQPSSGLKLSSCEIIEATVGAAVLLVAVVAAALDGYEGRTGRRLDLGQRHLVTSFAACSTLLAAGLGPAGSGKTTAMRALAHVLRQGGQRLIPLATSAAAADVLGRELGVRADNLHKFLHEHTRGPHAARLHHGTRLPAPARMYALNPGDVVLVDEAGMAGTFALDQLVTIASRRGALVRLIGDDRQLSAVESGGALRLIAHEAGAAELTALYRFTEAEATLRLRLGDASALDYYLARGRVRSGSREAMTEAAYAGWRADMLAGKTTLMTAASSTDVTALAAQARTERVDAGQVEAGGVPLRDGTLAGRGDWIVTRQNNRKAAINGGRDWVKNGDAWRVIKRHRNGALTVQHLVHGGRVTLPADYVAGHVQLLYATTAHRAQGTTVDTAHALITPEMSRESFYVTASRARHGTIFYTATHDLLPADEDDRLDAASTLPVADLRRLWAFFQEGGRDNAASLLGWINVRLGTPRPWREPEPLAAAGRFEAACRAASGESGLAAIIFYRSLLLSADTAPIMALADALAARGLGVVALYVTSLKDERAIKTITNAIAATPPDIMLNTTAFSARLESGSSVLDGANVPVLQVILAGSTEAQWRANPRGLGAADLAMNVVLPEMDGRLVTAAISCKAESARSAALEFTRLFHKPIPSRVDFVARLAANWVRLRKTPAAEQRIACILSDYPLRGGREGYAVGLDTPASVAAIAEALRSAGYAIGALPDGGSLMATLSSRTGASLPVGDYRRLFAALPETFTREVIRQWGEPEADPAFADGALRFRLLQAGRLIVALLPNRGSRATRKAERAEGDWGGPSGAIGPVRRSHFGGM